MRFPLNIGAPQSVSFRRDGTLILKICGCPTCSLWLSEFIYFYWMAVARCKSLCCVCHPTSLQLLCLSCLLSGAGWPVNCQWAHPCLSVRGTTAISTLPCIAVWLSLRCCRRLPRHPLSFSISECPGNHPIST